MTTLRISPEIIHKDPNFEKLSDGAKKEFINLIAVVKWMSDNLSKLQAEAIAYNNMLHKSQQSYDRGLMRGARWLLQESYRFPEAANA